MEKPVAGKQTDFDTIKEVLESCGVKFDTSKIEYINNGVIPPFRDSYYPSKGTFFIYFPGVSLCFNRLKRYIGISWGKDSCGHEVFENRIKLLRS